MSVRVVTLPNGRACGLGVYVTAWRSLIDITRLTPKALIKGFDHFPEEASRVLDALRDGLHDRINRHVPHYGKGRKWDHNWQRAAIQCAHEVNTPRLIVRYAPPDLAKRLAHRIHRESPADWDIRGTRHLGAQWND